MIFFHGPFLEPSEEALAREGLDRDHDDDKHIKAEEEGSESDDDIAELLLGLLIIDKLVQQDKVVHNED